MKTSACRNGTLKPSKLDGNDTTTLSHHPHILCHFAATYTNVLCVCSCLQKRVVEGSGVGSAGCEVHVDVHGECVMLWIAAMYNVVAIYTEHGRYGLSCLYAETVECMSSAGSVWLLGFNLCPEILLLLNMAVGSMEDCRVSIAEYLVHLGCIVCMNRLSACREFCDVHSWQNCTRCLYRDGVKVLWCHSHLVRMVCESSIPTCTCFHSEKFL